VEYSFAAVDRSRGDSKVSVVSSAMHKTLIVTNDFPPRPGGIQAFLHNMALRLDPERFVVYASTWKRSREGIEATAAFDAEQPFTVVRDRTTMLLPTPGATRRAVGLLREHGCTSVWFGAAAPLGLMAPALRRAGAERLVAATRRAGPSCPPHGSCCAGSASPRTRSPTSASTRARASRPR
jgi:phosphatidylinositol alpha-1,6-mannosyltransferase